MGAAQMMRDETFQTLANRNRTRSIPNPAEPPPVFAALRRTMPARFARGKSAIKIGDGIFTCNTFMIEVTT